MSNRPLPTQPKFRAHAAGLSGPAQASAPGNTPRPTPGSSLEVDAICQQAKEPCDREGTVLVREAPPGNPYRDLVVCESHADEMVESGLYFRV